jgi:iron complex transport system substrate-binding protein
LALSLLALATGTDAGAARPQRVVSLNTCADQLVLLLAHPNQVASVTFLASDPGMSPIWREAAGIPANRGSAEEVLRLHPDLVIAGTLTTSSARTQLARHGVPLIALDIPGDVDAIERQVRVVAAALDNVARGAAVIGDMRRRIDAAASSQPARRLVAVLYEANGLTVGAGSLFDDLLRRAGYANLADLAGIGSYGRLPLELLLAHPPDLLILDSAGPPGPSLAEATLRHRALLGLLDRVDTVRVPRYLWSCGGPFVADVVETLVRARTALERTAGR